MWFQSLGEPHIRQRGEKAPAGLGRNSPRKLDTGRGSVIRGVTAGPLWPEPCEHHRKHVWWLNAEGTDVVKGLDSGPRLRGFPALPLLFVMPD